MEKYELMEIEVIEFDTADIITGSNDDDTKDITIPYDGNNGN